MEDGLMVLSSLGRIYGGVVRRRDSLLFAESLPTAPHPPARPANLAAARRFLPLIFIFSVYPSGQVLTALAVKRGDSLRRLPVPLCGYTLRLFLCIHFAYFCAYAKAYRVFRACGRDQRSLRLKLFSRLLWSLEKQVLTLRFQHFGILRPFEERPAKPF